MSEIFPGEIFVTCGFFARDFYSVRFFPVGFFRIDPAAGFSPETVSLFFTSQFQLLSKDRVSMFAAVVRVGFLLFESLRSHLKLQLERFLVKLTDVVSTESPKIPYELRELALGEAVSCCLCLA